MYEKKNGLIDLNTMIPIIILNGNSLNTQLKMRDFPDLNKKLRTRICCSQDTNLKYKNWLKVK